MAQIWYPAKPAATATAASEVEHSEVLGPTLAAGLGLLPYFRDHRSQAVVRPSRLRMRCEANKRMKRMADRSQVTNTL